MPGVCRDCFSTLADGEKRCRWCSSPRIVFSPELEVLNVAHVDCDAFYASVEKREDPSLANLPVIVGGGNNGVVTTCCYIARISGVRSAMPIFKAKLLCPQAVIIKPRMKLYKKVSLEIRNILLSLTPLVQFVSIDEAFIDLTGTGRLHKKSPVALLAQTAKHIEETIGITVSIGLSFNKLFAKIGSDLEKPRGLTVVDTSDAKDIIKTKKISILRGVGEKTLERLHKDGITFIRDLNRYNKLELEQNYGALGGKLWHFSRGLDNSPVDPKKSSRSISKEITFDNSNSKPSYIKFRLWGICETVSSRLKKTGLQTSQLTLKIKTDRKKLITFSTRLERPTNLAELLFQATTRLFTKVDKNIKIKLVGISVTALSKLQETKTNFDLFFDEDKQLSAQLTEETMDSIRRKFGKSSIFKGRSFYNFFDRGTRT